MNEKEANPMQEKIAADRTQGIDPAVLQQLLQLMVEKKSGAVGDSTMMLSAAQNTADVAGQSRDFNLLMQLLEQRLTPEEKRKWETLRMMASLLGVR